MIEIAVAVQAVDDMKPGVGVDRRRQSREVVVLYRVTQTDEQHLAEGVPPGHVQSAGRGIKVRVSCCTEPAPRRVVLPGNKKPIRRDLGSKRIVTALQIGEFRQHGWVIPQQLGHARSERVQVGPNQFLTCWTHDVSVKRVRSTSAACRRRDSARGIARDLGISARTCNAGTSSTGPAMPLPSTLMRAPTSVSCWALRLPQIGEGIGRRRGQGAGLGGPCKPRRFRWISAETTIAFVNRLAQARRAPPFRERITCLLLG